ncbi:vitamin K-dependent protein C-like [Orussus abietinus]|uniref:vitamin K-dependent protein C-like n=1 Tax=Orussus abietinus TaxID=222816 RepID=UPI000C715DCC|nr:vitamin K-dependent protein C-like [Orussus abietinus]
MNLLEYIKYLICAILLPVASCLPPENPLDATWRDDRSVLDLIFGIFRTCGSCQCGRSNHGGARMMGGEFTDSHEFPWLANVLVKSNLQVSAVLINDRYVMTAASQLIGATSPEIKVSLGEYDRCKFDVSSANVSVEAVILHPEFNPESRARDLALIRLARPIKFERRISPICLPNPGSSYLGQVGTLAGWAESTGDSEGRTCRPRKVGLPILGYNECIKSGVDPSLFHDDSGCIGVIGGNSIVCNTDVGSSVYYRSYGGIYDLLGILSDVNECKSDPKTAVYTRIGPHINWILQQTRDACYCTK